MDRLSSGCLVGSLCSEKSGCLCQSQDLNVVKSSISHSGMVISSMNCESICDDGNCDCIEKRRKEWVLFNVSYPRALDNSSYVQASFSYKNKDRYPDIFACGNTRVKLSLDEVNESDYINANYIKGIHFSHPEYIATQAPLPGTCGDFWRMIWENKSGVIVMLTRLIEDNKIKACRYWPTKKHPSLTFGSITVNLADTRPTEYNFKTKVFLIEESGVKRRIVHYQFLNWSDYSIPEGLEILRLLQDIDLSLLETIADGLTGPLTIHCSAGIGRTGTFIAIHTCLKKLIEEKKRYNDIDMPDLVKKLRLQRSGMISNELQYLFCCQMIQTALSCYYAMVNEKFSNLGGTLTGKNEFNRNSIFEQSALKFFNDSSDK